jgi:glycosyltransferase involved in cell wall biosynthesis
VNVGLIVPGFSADPADWCIPALRDFVARLAMTDHVRVLTLRYPDRRRPYALFGAEVIPLGGGTGRGVASAALWGRALGTLAAEQRRRPFDVLHAFWATEPGAIAALAGRLLGVPTLVSVAGGELVALADIGYGDGLSRSSRLKARLALRWASAAGAGSRHAMDLAKHLLSPGRGQFARLLPLGVDSRRFPPQRISDPRASPRLVHVASLVPVKDQRTLLRACSLLARDGVAFELDVAGTGPLAARLAVDAARLGIADRVRWAGDVRHDRLPALYQAGDVFVLSSRHEAQGMALLEGAASGLPVASTAVGVAPELAPEGGVVVGVGRARALADALGILLRDAPTRRAMGEAARARVARDYELGKATEGFRAAYTALVG